ncbi:MAG: complex I subunit 4 family protein [Armatimonadota bacterium]
MLLTLLIAIPAIGGIAAWIVGHRSALGARWCALVATVADFALALYLWADFPSSLGPGKVFIEHNVPWVPQIGLSYHVAMDGLNLILVLLTCVIGIVAVLCSWHEITDRVGDFHLALMVLLAAINGTFMAFDILLFYFFWESMLVPMYFLIAIWGHENRQYAAMKFFLFTFIGGFFMLIGILGIYFAHARNTGVYTFSYPALIGTPMSAHYTLWLMLGFFVALTVKIPIVPLHTWLPDAHTEAPTAGSVVLAALLLKTGAYGLMRFAIPLFPGASAHIAPIGMMLGVAGIIYGAIMAYPQRDLKRMVAYTSVSHMGFVVLGIYAGNELALQGAMLAIVAHGFSTGALFLIVGMIQERTHTRDLDKLGGLWTTTPKLGGFTLFFALAALGLPGLANFVGEFLVLLGTFQASKIIAVAATLGLVLSVIYALRLVQRSMLGPNESKWSLPDLTQREIAILGALAALLLWLGLYPQPIFDTVRSPIYVIQTSLHQAEIHPPEAER